MTPQQANGLPDMTPVRVRIGGKWFTAHVDAGPEGAPGRYGWIGVSGPRGHAAPFAMRVEDVELDIASRAVVHGPR